MEQTAVVKRVLTSGVAEISLLRRMECGLSCRSCEGCPQKPKDELVALAENALGASVGDIVTVQPRAGSGRGVALLVFGLPCIGLICGYLLADGFRLAQGLCVLAAFVGLVVGFIPAVLANQAAIRSGKPEFTIISCGR